MICNLDNKYIHCPECGEIDFRLEERFELIESISPDFEKSYTRINPRKCIVCTKCGTILDESYSGHTLGIF